jgi:hypothetical protein
VPLREGQVVARHEKAVLRRLVDLLDVGAPLIIRQEDFGGLLGHQHVGLPEPPAHLRKGCPVEVAALRYDGQVRR